jgi:hypothetical protein
MLYANALVSTLRPPHQRGVEASGSHRRTRPYSWQTLTVFLYAQSEKHQESDPELRTSKADDHCSFLYPCHDYSVLRTSGPY